MVRRQRETTVPRGSGRLVPSGCTGATLRAQDHYGKLWATEIRLDRERVHLVEGRQLDPEADGTYCRYFLRVPPTIGTARAAVAWTFGIDRVADYAIAVQS